MCSQSLPEAEYKNIWLEEDITGAQLFSSGLRETFLLSKKLTNTFIPLCPRRGQDKVESFSEIMGNANCVYEHVIV